MTISKPNINNKQARFASVGTINTVVDLTVYGLLRQAFGFYFANLISTSVGMIIGYVLHRNYTFQATHARTRRELFLFFGLTIIGLWVIQPLVIYYISHPTFEITGTLPRNLQLLLPKCVAIAFGLIWNYLCYNYIVFKKKQSNDTL